MLSITMKKWNGQIYKDVVYADGEKVKVSDFVKEIKNAIIKIIDKKELEVYQNTFEFYGFKTQEKFEKQKERFEIMREFVRNAKIEDVIYIKSGLNFKDLYNGFQQISKREGGISTDVVSLRIV